MTWEEIIIKIRKDPKYGELVQSAYYEEELSSNVERFRTTEEFLETVKLIEKYCGSNRNKELLDIGAGNGIGSIAFALLGYNVSAVEPDKSETVGSGAIRKLKENYKLDNLSVYDSYGESLPFGDHSFDIVYIRQAMHHAAELDKFIAETARVLKPGGLLLTVRDHVIYNAKDKEWFLREHPLHRYYGGENAFTEREYAGAMVRAGLEIKEVLKHFDSVINYFPMSKVEYHNRIIAAGEQRYLGLKRRIGPLARIGLLNRIYGGYIHIRYGKLFDERSVPGRMYSFVAIKKA